MKIHLVLLFLAFSLFLSCSHQATSTTQTRRSMISAFPFRFNKKEPVGQRSREIETKKFTDIFSGVLKRNSVHGVLFFLPCEVALKAIIIGITNLFSGRMLKKPDKSTAGDRRLIAAAVSAARESNFAVRGRIDLRIFESKEKNACVVGGLLLPPSIIISRGLLDLPVGVASAVIAHELGHYKKKHIFVNLPFAFFAVSLREAVYMWTGCKNRVKSLLLGRNNSVKPNSCLIVASALGFDIAMNHVMSSISQKHEFDADEFAGDTVGEAAMILALQSLSGKVPLWLIRIQWSTGILIPTWLLTWLLKNRNHLFIRSWNRLSTVWEPSTHPTIEKRIRALTERREARKTRFVKYNPKTGVLQY